MKRAQSGASTRRTIAANWCLGIAWNIRWAAALAWHFPKNIGPASDVRGGIASQVLLQGFQACAQAGLITSSRILMQDALLDCLVQRGNCRAKRLFRGSFISVGQGSSQVAQSRAQA